MGDHLFFQKKFGVPSFSSDTSPFTHLRSIYRKMLLFHFTDMNFSEILVTILESCKSYNVNVPVFFEPMIVEVWTSSKSDSTDKYKFVFNFYLFIYLIEKDGSLKLIN